MGGGEAASGEEGTGFFATSSHQIELICQTNSPLLLFLKEVRR